MSAAQKLAAGLRELGVAAEPAQESTLLAYLELLRKWNQVYNLSAIRETESMVEQHLLDSVSILPFVRSARSIVDVGSGAGLPGIPLAVMRTDARVTVLDSSHKKTAFLRQASLELGLKNVCVVSERVETWKPAAHFDVVVSRAFADLPEFVDLAGHLCRRGGAVLAMKGLYPHEELTRIPEGFFLDRVEELTVPYLGARRHLVLLRVGG
jgi:16S rRNA (guanine527-N7)-methyltransferase